MSPTVAQLQSFADTVRPQSGFIGDLRAERSRLRALMTINLHSAFGELADRIEMAHSAAGDLVIEASANEAHWIERILGIARLREWQSARLTPMFQRAWHRALLSAANVFSTRTGQPADIVALQRQVLQMGGIRSGLLDITGDTRKALFNALDVAKARGLDFKEAAKLIRDYVPDGRFVNAGRIYRSEMIAKTEMRSAQNFAIAQLSRPGLLLASDGTGDDICASRDGQLFTPDEAIWEDSTTHPNCILSFAPIYGG